MSDCPDEDTLDEYVLRRLAPVEATKVENHIGLCEQCHANVKATQALIRALRDVVPPLTNASTRKRLRIVRRKRPPQDLQ